MKQLSGMGIQARCFSGVNGRKLSIASLPLILLSAIVHSTWLKEAVYTQECGDTCVTETFALSVGVLCLSMCFADVVLYVWVDDAFVRRHKKLVQVHYFVEILTRLPLILLLRLASTSHASLLVLYACDISANVLLLILPTLVYSWRRGMSCRHASSQLASAVIMSQILFLVNITVFDPREAFQVVNAGFGIVKYLEAFVICRHLWGVLPMDFFQTFCETLLAIVVLWSLVLPWEGEYTDLESGDRIRLEPLDVDRGEVLLRREAADVERGNALDSSLALVFGTSIEAVLDPTRGPSVGTASFDGLVHWNDAASPWRKTCPAPAACPAREVLRLVLMQILLSLRWEPTHLGLGPTRSAQADTQTHWRRETPLEPLPVGSQMQGIVEYWDSVRGIPLEAPDDLGGPCSFGQRALARLVQQAALWQETRELARLGIQTVGDASEKTRAVQERLQQLATETRDQVRLEDLEDNYFQELVQLDLKLGWICFCVFGVEPKREKCMVKVGDDLRQDQLVLQLLHFMEMVWEERLPSEESELLRFVPYRVLAMTPDAGYIKFVPGAVSLSKAFASSNGDLAAWLSTHQPRQMTKERVLSNLCGSAAAYCVATYVLGIGDRHLDNLQITPEGHFFHIDFGFIFGEDPKPFAPRLRLPEQIATVLMQEMDDLRPKDKCFRLAARAYIALRRSMSLWVALLRIIGQAGGAGCSGAKQNAAVLVVMDRLRADLDWACEEEKAATEFLWGSSWKFVGGPGRSVGARWPLALGRCTQGLASAILKHADASKRSSYKKADDTVRLVNEKLLRWKEEAEILQQEAREDELARQASRRAGAAVEAAELARHRQDLERQRMQAIQWGRHLVQPMPSPPSEELNVPSSDGVPPLSGSDAAWAAPGRARTGFTRDLQLTGPSRWCSVPPGVPLRYLPTMFRRLWILMALCAATDVQVVDMFRAAKNPVSSGKETRNMTNNNLAEPCLRYSFLPVVVLRRKYGIDSIARYRVSVRNPNSIDAKAPILGFSPAFTAFDYGVATNGDSLKELAQAGPSGSARADGSIVTWGWPAHESLNEIWKPIPRKYFKGPFTEISANLDAFAGIQEDGNLVIWGRNDVYENGVLVPDLGSKKVQVLQASCSAFAAIMTDGTVMAFGPKAAGGDCSAVKDQLHSVVALQATDKAFAALRSDEVGDFVGIQRHDQSDVAMIVAYPYYWFSLPGLCPNLPWTCIKGSSKPNCPKKASDVGVVPQVCQDRGCAGKKDEEAQKCQANFSDPDSLGDCCPFSAEISTSTMGTKVAVMYAFCSVFALVLQSIATQIKWHSLRFMNSITSMTLMKMETGLLHLGSGWRYTRVDTGSSLLCFYRDQSRLKPGMCDRLSEGITLQDAADEWCSPLLIATFPAPCEGFKMAYFMGMGALFAMALNVVAIIVCLFLIAQYLEGTLHKGSPLGSG
eukprot:g33411.t2